MHWSYWDVVTLPATTFQTLKAVLKEEADKQPKRKAKAGTFTASSE